MINIGNALNIEVDQSNIDHSVLVVCYVKDGNILHLESYTDDLSEEAYEKVKFLKDKIEPDIICDDIFNDFEEEFTANYRSILGEATEEPPALFGVTSSHVDQCLGYTEDLPIDLLQEECAELIQACSKISRKGDHRITRENLIEELAHVAISSACVAREYNITAHDIEQEIKKKRV